MIQTGGRSCECGVGPHCVRGATVRSLLRDQGRGRGDVRTETGFPSSRSSVCIGRRLAAALARVAGAVVRFFHGWTPVGAVLARTAPAGSSRVSMCGRRTVRRFLCGRVVPLARGAARPFFVRGSGGCVMLSTVAEWSGLRSAELLTLSLFFAWCSGASWACFWARGRSRDRWVSLVCGVTYSGLMFLCLAALGGLV